MTAHARWSDKLLIGFVGVCAFLGVYATQPLLPVLERTFHVDKARASLTISALTLAVALTAPLAGALSDRLGRKRFIVWNLIGLAIPTLLAATASSLRALIFWRFLQGLFVPGVIAGAMAYVGEQFVERKASAMSAYVTGTVLGGFLGRFLTGMIAARWGFRASFVVLGNLGLVGALLTGLCLPPARAFSPLTSSFASDLRANLREPRLLASYAVGFSVLFSLVGTFTYVTFYLDRPPFSLSPSALSFIFAVYLVGLVVTPAGGRLIDRLGYRRGFRWAIALSSSGILLTLLPRLTCVIAGLAAAASGVFVAQACTSSFVSTHARGGRASASGLYLMFYYAGGALGAWILAGPFDRAGWPGCVLCLLAVQGLTLLITALAWPPKRPDQRISPSAT